MRPGVLPAGLPRAPSLPRGSRAPLARSLSPPPGGSGGNWRSTGGAGVCPAGEGTGRGPRSLLSAPWGGAGGAPSPLSGSGSGGIGAGGGCGRRRRRQGLAGREGKGGRGARGSARGGAPGRGRGSGRRGGGCSPAPVAGAGRQAPTRAQRAACGLVRHGASSPGTKTQGGLTGRGNGEMSPARPHPGFRPGSGFVPFCPPLLCSSTTSTPRSL